MAGAAAEDLVHDHEVLSGILSEYERVFAEGNLPEAATLLDYFWARLALHIRAEHHVLFPRIYEKAAASSSPPLKEVEAVFGTLRKDHDLFMTALAEAVTTLKALVQAPREPARKEILGRVAKYVESVKGRLDSHNILEEGKVYLWLDLGRGLGERAEVAGAIRKELENFPPRFREQLPVLEFEKKPA